MSKKKRVITSVLFLLVLILLMWEFKPQIIEKRTFSFKETENTFLIDERIQRSGIISAKWEIRYPTKMDHGEESSITLSIEPGDYFETKFRPGEDTEVTIITKLETDGGFVSPGRTFYTAYNPTQISAIAWNVMAHSRDIKCKLWIYATPAEDNDLLSSPPLFVIPFEIRVISIFGLRPTIIRLTAFAAITAIIFLVFFVRSPRPQ